MTPVTRPFARITQGDARCGQCPEWHARTSVCLPRAVHQDPAARACRYGDALMREEGRARK